MLRLFLALWLAVSPTLSWAGSVTLLGAGVPPGAAAYVGPLDVQGSAYAYWGFRCSSTSYTGNVADIWDSATGSTTRTLLTCSSGGVINQTVNSLATTCASGCKVKTLYDQSGSLKCGGSACDVTQATNSKRPTFSSALTGLTAGRYGMTCAAGSSTALISSAATTQAQPVSISWVATRTGGIPGQTNAISQTITQLGFDAANTVFTYAGSSYPNGVTANDNAWHAFQTVLTGSSTASVYVNGTSNNLAGFSGGTGFGNNAIALCADNSGTLNMTGGMVEVIFYASALNGTAQSNLDLNQKNYWGYTYP